MIQLFSPSYLVYSQIWLNQLMDDGHFGYITNFRRGRGWGLGERERGKKKKTLTLIGLTQTILSPNPTQMPSLFPNGQIQKERKKKKASIGYGAFIAMIT
jgi:hypothetical protein